MLHSLTPFRYMAPEVIRASEKAGALGASDIWSMGCVLLEISTGWVTTTSGLVRPLILAQSQTLEQLGQRMVSTTHLPENQTDHIFSGQSCSILVSRRRPHHCPNMESYLN